MTQGYRLLVEPIEGEVSALRDGAVIAQSGAARLMRETRLPSSVYFPKEAITGASLQRSEHRTFCPFKGTAAYWDAVVDGERIENAVWSYEEALPESKAVEGMLGLMPHFTDQMTFSAGSPTPTSDGHVAGPLVDWIMREGAFCPDGAELTRKLGERFVAHGIAVKRLSIFLWSLHPEIAGVRYGWDEGVGAAEPFSLAHDFLDDVRFQNSPLRHVSDRLGGIRERLIEDESKFDFPILGDLKEQGMTDYVAMPLIFSDGRFNVMTMATDHPAGFTTANLGLVFECASAISRYFEVHMLRANTVALLDTYVGARAGERVLGGEIKRGDGDDIEAAILFTDLCGSTRWAEQLGRDAYLELLNAFFEAVSREVGARGGEVLKFIGDAVLAIFPAEDDPEGARRRAVEAARAIPEAVAALRPEDPPGAASGLSFGPVTYGNVGAPDRLDFTVIGKAATVAARLSDLAKTKEAAAIATTALADAAARPMGSEALHNIAEPVEVCAL